MYKKKSDGQSINTESNSYELKRVLFEILLIFGLYLFFSSNRVVFVKGALCKHRQYETTEMVYP